MLLVKKIVNIIKPKIEYDFYVPIKIIFGDWQNSVYGSFYWFTGCLFELGINSENGCIRSLTLVSVKKVYLDKKIDVGYQLNETVGLPVFYTDKWIHNNVRYLDENRDKDFDVYLSDNSLGILLVNHTIRSQIVNYNIIFGLDSSNLLCYIEVTNIEKENIDLLKESLSSKLIS